jgi:hypothetical protein
VTLFEAEARPLVEETPELAPVPKHTERDMLDAIHRRYSKTNPGNGPRYVVAEHVRNQCGFGGWYGTGRLRTVDALVVDLWPSSGHLIHGFEVKCSRADWLTELKDPEKADAFRPYCHHWWLVVPDARIVRDDLPDGWGLLALNPRGELRARVNAPRNEPTPMPFEMTAAWLRATAKTAKQVGEVDGG